MMDERSSVENRRNYSTVYAEDQVDVPPEIEGGMDGFYERILDNRPPRELIEEQEGHTIVFLIVSPQGEPTNVAVQEATFPAIGESVRSVVLNSSFTPGRYEDEPVPVAITLNASFVMGTAVDIID